MNENLSEVLRGFVQAEDRLAAAMAPDPVSEVRLLSRRASRRRAARTGSTVLSVALVVGAVVAGFHAFAPQVSAPAMPTQHAASPSPSPSVASPSRNSSTAPAALAGVTTDPLLPRAEPMTAGMLEEADSSWRLFRYQPFADLQGDSAPAVVYLISPDDRLFEVPTPSTPGAWYLLDWLPGTRSALIIGTQDGETRVIDLLSGETTLDLGTWLWDARFLHDGTRDVAYVAEGALRRVSIDGGHGVTSASFSVPYGTTAWIPSPEGSAVVLNADTGPRVVSSADLAPLEMPSPYPARPDACRAWMWVTPTDVLPTFGQPLGSRNRSRAQRREVASFICASAPSAPSARSAAWCSPSPFHQDLDDHVIRSSAGRS